MNQITMRERLLAMLRGEPADKVPFVAYEGLGVSTDKLMRQLGPERLGVLRWTACHTLHTPTCARRSEPAAVGGRPVVRTCIDTPRGTVWQDRLNDPLYAAGSVKTPFLKGIGDFEILLCYLRDTEVVPSLEAIELANAELAEYGLVHCVVPRTPYQQLLVEWVNAEELNWYLLENAPLVLACLDEMIRILREVFAIVVQAPVPYVVFPDNLHAPVIGRTCFNRYCVPLYNELADLLGERAIPILARADGDLRQLSSDILDSRLTGIEALAPPPAHDMGIGEALDQWPNRIIGARFPASLHLKPASIVYDKAMELVSEGGDSSRLFLQIADTIPQGRWSISLPAISKAIDDHAESLSV